MGNMLKMIPDLSHSLTCDSDQELVQEDLLLQKLSELQKVELWRVHWGLSQHLQDNIPPIPPRWLWSADALSTAKIMLRCYHEEVALKVLNSVLRLIGQDNEVHHLSHTIKLVPIIPQKPDPGFVKIHRRRLISRMQDPDAILDSLEAHGILNNANREAISIYALCKDKTRALVDLILWKGVEAQQLFCHALSQSEPFLLQELEDISLRDKNPSETSVLTDMLEFLTSDELRCFQWLVKDHVTNESHTLSGGEQLQFSDKQAESIALKVLLRIVPVLSVYLPEEVVTSQSSSCIRADADVTPVEVKPEVHEDGNMFRLFCGQPSVSHCHLTGLALEGFGDVVYQTVPWDMDFLASKGLRPAGPLYKFRLLTGHFHRLHLPHCQLLPDSGQHFLSVAHITKDHMDLIPPVQVTNSHVIVDVSGFSCFGLLMPAESCEPINGLVLLFSQPSDSSLFVLLLPRNISITQVQKEWKRRIGAEYVEAIPDCELIPNQTYKLSGQPVTVIQPESSKFVNFEDYNNFLPSFQVQLADDASKVELHLKSEEAPLGLISWLFASTKSVVWSRVVNLRAAASTVYAEVCSAESRDESFHLLRMLECLKSEDFKTFQHHLSCQSDSIPVSRLEAADRTRTVELMVQQYPAEGATEVTIEILKKMKQNRLADHLTKRLNS
ncbi:hypothetical protein EXN66_Car006233 [Channa argus]|uniref:Uncharacterized protein n=1 Tax=Channa argus TaxID=215402 RepID=A0A6G1PJT6_CHAAH|nr:hypothetical protein EXN66_Car006233 [Channa argus]